MQLSDEEFWQLTPREFHRLYNRKHERERRKRKEAEFRAGIIASTIANCFRDSDKRKKPYTAQDFMPREKAEKDDRESYKDQLKFVEALNAAMGGTDTRRKKGGDG